MTRPIILFDLDGTLIDSTEAILESFAYACRRFGKAVPDRERVTAMIGIPLGAMFERTGVPDGEVPRFVEAYKERYRAISCEKTRLLPGAKEALERASAFARLGVVTTKTGKYSIEILKHLGVMDCFETLVGSEDVTRHKPHPEPIFEALRRMGGTPAAVWMVGDTTMDMEAAKRAGAGAVAVGCGYGTPEALEGCSDKVAKDAVEAVEWIARSLRERG
ncbi:HAD family hydrolase [Hydrogenimonas sp. SS33]|uniref:HAD family hydrolase n=1 Tax=Hydrogenimonas leucolamina TaxID=2954236 RepID=UPI00336BE1D9